MLKLNLDIQIEKVQIGSGASFAEYTIQEMNQKERDEYLDKQEPRLLRNEERQVIGMKTQSGFRADLLCLCLRDQEGKLVSAETVQSWPAQTVEQLHTVAQKLNGLGVKDDASKKASAA